MRARSGILYVFFLSMSVSASMLFAIYSSIRARAMASSLGLVYALVDLSDRVDGGPYVDGSAVAAIFLSWADVTDCKVATVEGVESITSAAEGIDAAFGVWGASFNPTGDWPPGVAGIKSERVRVD